MYRLKRLSTARRGDTVIEVTFAIVIFSLVAVGAIALMNSSTNTAQASLEITMTRSEMAAQAEALRFIHNAFTMERSLVPSNQQYVELWRTISALALLNRNSVGNPGISSYPISSCESAYKWVSDDSIFADRAFIINVRNIRAISSSTPNWQDELNTIIIFSSTSGQYDSANADVNTNSFEVTPLYPRIVYTASGGSSPDNSTTGNLAADQSTFTRIHKAQGIWIVPVASGNLSSQGVPEFYDFHIRTCWYAPGKKAPSTIGTIIRLYNPEHFEAQDV